MKRIFVSRILGKSRNAEFAFPKLKKKMQLILNTEDMGRSSLVNRKAEVRKE